MKSIISLLCAATFASASSGSLAKEDKDFFNFVAKNNKFYKTFSEMTKRKANWKKSKQNVEAMNSVKSQAVFNINNTADLDDDEYRLILGFSIDFEHLAQLKNQQKNNEEEKKSGLYQLQTEAIDWSINGLGHMTEVKNQLQCGSSWAFAATGALEATQSITQSALRGSFVPPVRLSEQDFLDCTVNTDKNLARFKKNYNNSGCLGGLMSRAWNFARDWGVMTNADYPYTQRVGSCLHDNSKIAVKAGNKLKIPPADALQKLKTSPLTIAIAAGSPFRFYKSGILTSADLCPDFYLDHGVIIVGYAVEENTIIVPPTYQTICKQATLLEYKAKTCKDSISVFTEIRKTLWPQCCKSTEVEPGTTKVVQQPTWKIQNSWGSTYGDEGFVKFAKEDTGNGVCNMNLLIESIEVAPN